MGHMCIYICKHCSIVRGGMICTSVLLLLLFLFSIYRKTNKSWTNEIFIQWRDPRVYYYYLNTIININHYYCRYYYYYYCVTRCCDGMIVTQSRPRAIVIFVDYSHVILQRLDNSSIVNGLDVFCFFLSFFKLYRSLAFMYFTSLYSRSYAIRYVLFISCSQFRLLAKGNNFFLRSVWWGFGGSSWFLGPIKTSPQGRHMRFWAIFFF